MESVFWKILVVAMMVITYIAFRHPISFKRKIAYPLLAFSVLSILFMSVYNISGLGVNVTDLIEEVSKSDAKNSVVKFYAQRVNERYNLQIKSLLIGGSLSAYLLFLVFIPEFLKKSFNMGMDKDI